MRLRIEFLTGMALFGSLGILRRLTPLPTGFITMVRLVIAILFIGGLLLVLRRKPDGALVRQNLKYLIPSGACVGLYMVTAFESYLYTSVATATLFFYMAPIFLVLLSPVLFGERLTKAKLLCVAGAGAGLVLISGVIQNGGIAPGELRGILLASLTSVMMGLVMALNKKMTGLAGLERTLLQFVFALAAVTPFVLLREDFSEMSFTASCILFLLITAIFATGVAYFLYFRGLEGLPMQTSAMFSYMEPVTAILLSALVLGEWMRPSELLGAVLLIGSALLIERCR